MRGPTDEVERVPMQLLHGCVVASIQIELGGEVLQRFQTDLLAKVRDTAARAVVLDLSGVAILDSADFESLRRTLAMAQLMGARPIIAGLGAGIAASLAELGADAEGVTLARSLAQAIEVARRGFERPES